ncbi:MAG: zinc-ribbon domain-containing protein [Clostridiales bacterium]|nr:zinc-ribbon domain-containing protein [Clostridiales bacterium]
MEENTVNSDLAENITANEEVTEQRDLNTICVKCGAVLDSDSDFCSKCGTPIIKSKLFCEKCGAEVKEDQAFCPKCGHKVGTPVNNNSKAKRSSGIKSYIKILIPVALIVIAVITTIVIINDSKIDSIAFETKTMELLIGESTTNPYSILPAKKQDKKVNWYSSDPSVASVSVDGTILAVGEGDCTITVSRGDKHDEFNVHVLSVFEGNLLKGNYLEAYEAAENDEQKELVFAENLAAVKCASVINSLKDPSSFVLKEVYYDSDNTRIVLRISGNNSFGGRASSYWLYRVNEYTGEWSLFVCVPDLEKEEYYTWDDADDILDKAFNNLGRDYISESMKNGIQLDKSAITRINTLFEEDKLDDVKLIENG